MPTLVQSAETQRRLAVVSQFGSRVFSRPQEGASGFAFPGNQVVMVSDFNMPGLGATPITHEGRLAADFATPLRGQPELPSASFNVFLRPTQAEESRDDGLQSFVRIKKTGEPTEFRRMSPSDGQGELFYYKSAGWIIDVGESAATTSGGLMVPVSWQAIEERKTITPRGVERERVHHPCPWYVWSIHLCAHQLYPCRKCHSVYQWGSTFGGGDWRADVDGDEQPPYRRGGSSVAIHERNSVAGLQRQ